MTSPDTTSPTSTAARRWRVPVAALIAAIAVRLVVGVDLYLHDPLTRAPVSDALYYDAWARTLAAGEVWRPGEAHWMPPLYPWLLAALYTVTGGALVVTLFVQSLVGLLDTLLVARLVQRVLAPRAARLALWGWVLYAPIVLTEQRLLAENAAMPFVLLGLLASVESLERLRAGRAARLPAILAGVWFGLACLARPNILFGPLGLALGAAFDLARARRTGEPIARRATWLAALVAALVGGALSLGAGLATNLVRSGEAVLVSANGGVNFWLGNNDRARGTFAAPGIEWGDIFAQRDVAFAGAARELHVDAASLSERAVSRHWFGRGLAWLSANPWRAASLMAHKFAANLSSSEYDVQVVASAVRVSARSLWLLALPFGVVLALALLARTKDVRWSGALIGWIAAAQIAVLMYFSYSRFRLPWYPALLPFAAAGLVGLLEREHWPKWRTMALALAALVLSYWPTEGAYPRQLHANALVDAARAHGRSGDEVEQRALLESALDAAPTDAKALADLAGLEVRAGREQHARELLEQSLAVDYPPARLDLARLLWSSSDPAVYDPERGKAVLREWLATRGADAYGALELGVALGDELARRAPFEPASASELRQLVPWLAAAHGGKPAFEEFAARAARVLER